MQGAQALTARNITLRGPRVALKACPIAHGCRAHRPSSFETIVGLGLSVLLRTLDDLVHFKNVGT